MSAQAGGRQTTQSVEAAEHVDRMTDDNADDGVADVPPVRNVLRRSRSGLGRSGVLVAGLLIIGLGLPSLLAEGRLSLVTAGLIFGLAASSLGLVWGQAGQVSVAHAALFGLGAYAAVLTGRDLEMGFGASLLIALLVGTAAGLIAGLPLLRLTGHYFAILSFAIAMIIETLEVRLYSLTGGVTGVGVDSRTLEWLGLDLTETETSYRLTLLLVGGTLAILAWLRRTRFGGRLRAIRDNPTLAQSLGIPVRRERLLAFSLSGAVAGLAGALYAVQTRYIVPEFFGLTAAIALIAVVLLGGARVLLGPVVGALIYYLLPDVLGLSPLQNQMAFGVILIVAVLTLPNGLVGAAGASWQRAWSSDGTWRRLIGRRLTANAGSEDDDDGT